MGAVSARALWETAIGSMIRRWPIPRTRWARTRDGVDIACQDLGEGDVTILLLNGLVSHLEVYREQPRYERFMRRLATGMRVLVMDNSRPTLTSAERRIG